MRSLPTLLLTVSTAVLAPSVARADADIGTFPIAFSIADEDGEPVRDIAWIDAQLARAETLFGADGVHFTRASVRAIAESHAEMVTRADRDKLGAIVLPHVINVFVVATLKDVDEADRYRFGVHWRPSQAPDKRFIILSSFAPEGVLAHELGHYFGNPHTKVSDNVMSYIRTGATPFFDDAQLRTIRATGLRILAQREVWPASTLRQ